MDRLKNFFGKLMFSAGVFSLTLILPISVRGEFYCCGYNKGQAGGDDVY